MGADQSKAAQDIQHAFSNEVWDPNKNGVADALIPWKNGVGDLAQQALQPVMPILDPIVAPIVNTIAPPPPLPEQLIEPPPQPLPQPPPVVDSQLIAGIDNETFLLVAVGLTAAVLLLD